MYREQHERKCPFYSEWMSATAPKCLNCGHRMDEVDEAEDEDDRRPVGRWLVAAGVVIALPVGVLVFRQL